jgi:hypothetical protein
MFKETPWGMISFALISCSEMLYLTAKERFKLFVTERKFDSVVMR